MTIAKSVTVFNISLILARKFPIIGFLLSFLTFIVTVSLVLFAGFSTSLIYITLWVIGFVYLATILILIIYFWSRSVVIKQGGEDYINSKSLLGNPSKAEFVNFLINKKIFKNKKSAVSFLVVLVFFIIALTIYLGVLWLVEPKGPGYVEDKFGNRYTPAEYIQMLNEGKDPLSPNFEG